MKSLKTESVAFGLTNGNMNLTVYRSTVFITMKNSINYDIYLVDSGTGLENTYSLSFESPIGIIVENIQFRASEDNVINRAIECLSDNLKVLAECAKTDINKKYQLCYAKV